MELQYFGANCLRITTKRGSVVVDDNLESVGLKSITKPDDIVLQTNPQLKVKPSEFVIDMPGEYEVRGIVIHGVPARSNMDKEDQMTSVIYTISAGDTKVAVLGHIFPELSDAQVEQIGRVDVAVVPVGDSGYTMDGIGALKVIKEIEPKVVIPTHYADKAIKYEVAQAELTDGLKGLSMEPAETTDKFKPIAGELTDATRLVVLQRQ